MSGLKTAQERNKWAMIQRSADTSIDRLSKGIASTQDLKTVGEAIGRYDELARTIFDQAVDSMAEQARAIVLEIEKQRESSGKKPLSEKAAERLIERHINSQLLDKGPDLIETIKSMLLPHLDGMDDKLDLIVKNTDGLSKSTQLVGRTPRQPGVRGPDKQPRKRRDPASLVGKTKDVTDVAASEPVTANGQPVSMLPRPDAQERRPALRSPVHQVNPWDQFRSFVSKLWRREDKRKDKEKDSWWRKFKHWVGGKYKKAKDFAMNPWVQGVAKALGLALLSPGLYQAMTEKAKEIFTWDNIVKAGEYVLNQITEKGPELLSWLGKVAMSVGKGAWNMMVKSGEWVVDKIRSFIPSWMGGYTEQEKKDKAAQLAGGPPSPTAPDISAPAGGGASSSTPSGMPTLSASTAPPPTSTTKPQVDVSALIGRGQTEGGSFNYAPSKTESATNTWSPTITTSSGDIVVNPNYTDAGTRSVAETQVRDTGSIITDAPITESETGGSSASARAASGSSAKTGLASFGPMVGVDDQLALMNLGLLGG